MKNLKICFLKIEDLFKDESLSIENFFFLFFSLYTLRDKDSDLELYTRIYFINGLRFNSFSVFFLLQLKPILRENLKIFVI